MRNKIEVFEVENMLLELKTAGVLPNNMSTTIERTDNDDLIVRTSTAYPPVQSGVEGVTMPETKTFTAEEIMQLYQDHLGNKTNSEQ